MTPKESEKIQRALRDAVASEAVTDAENSAPKWQRQQSLDIHDRMMASRAADAARDTLHDGTPFKESGSYTVHEARDRAAHTPSIARREER